MVWWKQWLVPAWRFSHLIALVVVGLLASACIIQPALWINPQRNHQRIRLPIVQWWFRRVAAAVRLRVTVVGQPPPEQALYVSNHITWMDIIVVGSQIRASFVSKQEVRNWPVIGWMCAVAGTIFIRRGSLDSASATQDTLRAALDAGKSIAVFPEGTSTDGATVKPFKRRLFVPAMEAGCVVQPISLRYPDGDQPNLVVPYIDDDNLFSNVLRVIRLPEIPVRVTFGAPLEPTDDPRALAHAAWEISHAGVTSPSPQPRASS